MPIVAANAMGALFRFAQADPASAAAGAGQAAQAAAQGAQKTAAGGGDGMMSIVMMLGIFAVFWFLILRPQQKRAKEHKDFLGTLKVGSKVVTNAGMFGKITSMKDNVVTIEIAPKVSVRMLRSQVAGLENNAQQAVENMQAR